MNKKFKKQSDVYDGFLVLGAAWLIAGLVIYNSISGIWTLGFIFLLIGLIGRYGRK